ncbi:acyltransferase [Geminocystis sp. CENA526]|uniref:acyltransferase n=1 Tax=Geminocystis sp. CENA526 TaxID=1355871 RepID=UPI003D6FD2EF
MKDNCWIGTHVTILDGVTIHERAVIGAGAVVTKDVLPNSVVVGNPARHIRYRGENEGNFNYSLKEKYRKSRYSSCLLVE